jgi:hypothetical protein
LYTVNKMKESAYLIRLNEETNEMFVSFSNKLGWNKKDTILKLIFFFKELLPELGHGRELVIQIRDENNKNNIIKEKTASFDLLRTPS